MLKSLDFTPESSGMDKSCLQFSFRKITLAVVGLEEGDEARGGDPLGDFAAVQVRDDEFLDLGYSWETWRGTR